MGNSGADVEEEPPHRYRFDAFISYATRADYHLARKLESFLEAIDRLRTPAGQTLRKLEICTDVGDFGRRSPRERQAAGSQRQGIEDLLEDYLQASRFLVVLCSPDAASSRWVAHEVEWFLKNRGPDAILLAVTNGEPMIDPRSVFPAAVVDAGLQERRSWYDFRGASQAGRKRAHADVVRDFEEQRLRLAADLLERSPGEIQPLWYREQRRAQRRRVGLLSVASSVLVVLLILTFQAWRVAQRERRLAEARERTATSRRLAAQAVVQIDVHPDQALLLAVLSRRIEPTLESESALLAALQERPQLRTLLHQHSSMILCLDVSADGRRIVAGTFDGRILRFDLRSGHALGPPLEAHADSIDSVKFLSDRTFLSAADDGRIVLWDADSGRRIGTWTPPEAASGVNALAVSRDRLQLAIGNDNGTILIWSLPGMRPLGPPLRADGHMEVAFDPTGRLLASASIDDGMRLWDLSERRTIRRMPLTRDVHDYLMAFGSMAFAPDGRYLAASGDTGTVKLWDLRSAAPPLTLGGHSGDVQVLAFSPDSRTLAAGDDQNVTLWETANGTKKELFGIDHTDVVKGLAFTRDGAFLVSGASDGTIRLWSVRDASPIGTYLGSHDDAASSVAFSRNGRYLASGGEDGTVRFWSVLSGRQIRTVTTEAKVRRVAFSHRGTLLASTSADHVVLWNVANGQAVGRPLASKDARDVVFTADDRTLIVSGDGGFVEFWDVASGTLRAQAPRNGNEITSEMSLTADGSQLILGRSGDKKHEFPIYAVATAMRTGSFPLDTEQSALALSRDDTLLATGGYGPVIRLWDFRSRKLLRRLLGLRTHVWNLAFGARGRLASGAGEGLWLWDVESGTRIGRRLFRKHVTEQAVFSPDGLGLAAANADGSVWLWDLRPDVWQMAACRIANRDLSAAEWSVYMGDRPYFTVCSDRIRPTN